MTTIAVRYDKKKGMLSRVDGTWTKKLTERMEVPFSLVDFVTPGKVGFEALHEQLGVLAKAYHFALPPVITAIANIGVLRRKIFSTDFGVPPYVVVMLFKLLRDSNACVDATGSALRKTEAYVMFLRNVVNVPKTMQSVSSGITTQKYQLPSHLDEMTVEMIGEELRVAEELEAKPKVLEVLRRAFHQKQEDTQTVTVKGKTRKKTEFEQFSEAIKEVNAEDKVGRRTSHGDDGAEYSDLPSKKRRK